MTVPPGKHAITVLTCLYKLALPEDTSLFLKRFFFLKQMGVKQWFSALAHEIHFPAEISPNVYRAVCTKITLAALKCHMSIDLRSTELS